MSERILVRGEISPWVHAGRVCAVLAALAGVGIGLGGMPWGWALLAVGIVSSICLESMAWQARRSPTWLTLHPDGLEVEDSGGHRAIHDSQVSAVALLTRKNLANGELTSITRKFTIWAEDWPEPVLMENRIKIGKVDPIAGLIERLLNRLQTRFEQDLARGGTASGDDWHLSRSALTIGRSPRDQQLPLSDIAAIESRDGQMCIWRRGVDEAVAKLPLSGRNVYLLPALAQPYQSVSAGPNAPANTTGGLGRVLFERRAGRGTVLALAIAGIGLMAVGVALVVSLQQKQNDDAVIGALFTLGGGVILLGFGYWFAFTVFRCHEQGVWRKTPFSQQSLRYADVGRYSYSAIRHYHNGAYIGTQVTMRFVPLPEANAKAMKYTARTKGEDDDLDRLRDSISQQIAVRLARQFQAGQNAPWTANLEFTQEGIRFRSQKWFSRQPPQLLSYDQYGGYDMKNGVFYLFARGQKKAIMTEQGTAENFYPGFFLLQMLLHQPAENVDPAEAAN